MIKDRQTKRTTKKEEEKKKMSLQMDWSKEDI